MELQNTSLNAFGSSRIRFTSSNLSNPTMICSMQVVNGSTFIFKKMALCKRILQYYVLKLITFRNSNIYSNIYAKTQYNLSIYPSIYHLPINLPISRSFLLSTSCLGKHLRQAVHLPPDKGTFETSLRHIKNTLMCILYLILNRN